MSSSIFREDGVGVLFSSIISMGQVADLVIPVEVAVGGVSSAPSGSASVTGILTELELATFCTGTMRFPLSSAKRFDLRICTY